MSASGQLSENRTLSYLSQICFSPKYCLSDFSLLENQAFVHFISSHNRYYLYLKQWEIRVCSNEFGRHMWFLRYLYTHSRNLCSQTMGENHQHFWEFHVLKRCWREPVWLSEFQFSSEWKAESGLQYCCPCCSKPHLILLTLRRQSTVRVKNSQSSWQVPRDRLFEYFCQFHRFLTSRRLFFKSDFHDFYVSSPIFSLFK